METSEEWTENILPKPVEWSYREEDLIESTYMIQRGGVRARGGHGLLTQYLHLQGGQQAVVGGATALLALLLRPFARVTLSAASGQIFLWNLLFIYIPKHGVI